MTPLIKFETKNKNVRIWSDRRKQAVNVEVSYNRIKAGDFTLFQICSMRNGGHDGSPRQVTKAA